MTRIGIFTTNSVDKLHPRIEMQVQILKEAGYSVAIHRSTSRREGGLFELLNLVYLKYFKWRSIFRFSREVEAYDIIHIYDLQLLPLAKRAKKRKKKVVYETLDDNVYLTLHAVVKKLPFLKPFSNGILRRKANYERWTASAYCDEVIVNSANLLENFDRASLIYYASHLEVISAQPFDSSKPSAFLYLGKLTEGKGANIYKGLLEKFQVKLIFLGKAYDSAALELLDSELVDNRGNFAAKGLIAELSSLVQQFNLVGLSIILPENKSYALQEANKDIDYMAMGIPFIGNDRQPTFEKIKEGAGVLFDGEDSVLALIENKDDLYNKASNTAKLLYQQNYCCSIFRKNFLEIYLRNSN